MALVFGVILYVELFAGTQLDVSALWLLVILVAALCLAVLSVYALIQKRRIGGIGLGVSVLGLAWLVFSFGPGSNRIISPVTASDGTEMCLLHLKNEDWGEPYSISFCYRKPGKPWKVMYYDHQDLRWWFGKISIDGSGERVVVRRFILPVAYFDIATEQFTIVRWGRMDSGDSAARSPTWTPEGQLRR